MNWTSCARTERSVCEEAVEFVDENTGRCTAKGEIDSLKFNDVHTPECQYVPSEPGSDIRVTATSEVMKDSDSAGWYDSSLQEDDASRRRW